MTDQVLTFIENNIGRIRLNRPKAIHALTPDMCDAINTALLAWRTDDSVTAVMIDHTEGRGFCAGGDIALIANSAKADCVEAERFFHLEYRMNHLLFVYEKPIVAFIDGIVMGGGVGISLPARYRVATERTTFAMPETGIGLFPDVGGGWYLPRLPGRVGAWLAATGARIDGADCAAIGIATHYMPSDTLDDVNARILADPASLTAILDAAAQTPPPSKLDAARPDIDRLFASNKAEEIVAALRQLIEGAAQPDFAANMAMEYGLACAIIRRPDFVEGVRALIFDKDNKPQWNPATLEQVSDAMIDAIFTPLPADRQWTPLPDVAT